MVVDVVDSDACMAMHSSMEEIPVRLDLWEYWIRRKGGQQWERANRREDTVRNRANTRNEHCFVWPFHFATCTKTHLSAVSFRLSGIKNWITGGKCKPLSVLPPCSRFLCVHCCCR